MSYLPPEEQVIVLSTKKPMRRWLQILLKTLAVLMAVAAVVAAIVGWRYYSVHKQLKRDLTQVIRQEEHVRALGGINTAPDMLAPNAPDSWRFRYISSVRARRGLAEPEILVQSVDYDGRNAQVHLLLNGVDQYRHYRLYTGKDWRRAPFEARGWGQQHRVENIAGFELVFWDKDEALAQNLIADLPALINRMQSLELVPTTHKLNIIPQEFDDLAHPAHVGQGLTLNSTHVDVIPASDALSSRQNIRLSLAQQLIRNAHPQTKLKSNLPGASRVQLALGDLLAWDWAAGDVPHAKVADWAKTLKGQWVSPITGLSPTVITELPPDASDAAAHLMIAWILRTQGPNTLIALNKALDQYDTWDALYADVLGLQAMQVEAAAQAMAAQPDAAPPGPPAASHTPAPARLTLLTTAPDAHGRVLAQTPTGETILLQAQANVRFTLVDGSALNFDCVASGSQATVQGHWLEQDRRLAFDSLVLERASLPPILQSPAMDAQATTLLWRYQRKANQDNSQVSLVQQLPDGKENVIATPIKMTTWSLPPTFSRPGQPPLMLWTQSVRCNRDWLVAYDPALGTAGAWLLPAQHSDILNASYLPQANAFEVTLMDGAHASIYRTAAQHRLQKIDPETSPANKIPANKPISDELFIQLSRQLNEQLPGAAAYSIPAFGLPADQLIFAISSAPKSENLLQLVQVSQDDTSQMRTLFTISARGRATSMTPCPDGSTLYGLEIAHNPQNQGILRLHKSSGEDVAISARGDNLYSPVYCARAPLPPAE